MPVADVIPSSLGAGRGGAARGGAALRTRGDVIPQAGGELGSTGGQRNSFEKYF